jgi:serine/threonine protein kinase
MKPDLSTRTWSKLPSQLGQVDTICDAFAALLDAGERPRIEEHLGRTIGDERQTLLSELLRMEIEWRAKNGDIARPEDYLVSFPADAEVIQQVCGKVVLQAGAQPLPEYELVRKLGQGGFGEVWQARGPGGVNIAMKFIPLEGKGSALEVRALEVMKDIRHANLVSVFGVWHKDGRCILAMELCERSLLARLQEATDQKPAGIPRKELLDHMSDAAKGLDELNSHNVQHRDVKPANLLLLGKSVKVADFGLAKMLENTVASNTGAMTPAYTAPECCDNRIAKQSDQYSLAMTYYHLRTAKMLFSGSLANIVHSHQHQEPDLGLLTTEEQKVVARALAKKPEERWPDCKTFVNELVNAYNASVAKSTLPAKSSRALSASHRDIDNAAIVLERVPPSDNQPTELAPPSDLGPRSDRPTESNGSGWPIMIVVGVGMLLLLACGVGAGILALGPRIPASNPATQLSLPTTTTAAPTQPARAAQEPARLTTPFTPQQAKEAQAAWAKFLGRTVEETAELGG